MELRFPLTIQILVTNDVTFMLLPALCRSVHITVGRPGLSHRCSEIVLPWSPCRCPLATWEMTGDRQWQNEEGLPPSVLILPKGVPLICSKAINSQDAKIDSYAFVCIFLNLF